RDFEGSKHILGVVHQPLLRLPRVVAVGVVSLPLHQICPFALAVLFCMRLSATRALVVACACGGDDCFDFVLLRFAARVIGVGGALQVRGGTAARVAAAMA